MNSHNENPDHRPNSGSPEDLVRNWFNESGNGQNSNDSLSQSIGTFIQIIRENRWAIIALMVLACIAGVLKAVSEKPVYQARLTMAVEPSSVRSGNQSVFDPYAYRFYETQYELLKSRSVAERVVEELKLAERESVQKMLITPSLWRSLAVEFKKMTGIQLYGEELARPSLSSQTDTEKKARAAWLTAIIQGGVNVSGGEKTNLVSVSFNSTNPEFAAEIANSLVQAYISQGLDSQLDRTQQRSQWLSQRIDELKKTLNLAQAELQKFLVEEEMLGSNRSNKVDDSELQVLNNEVIATRATLDDLAKRYGARHPRITEARAEYNAAKGRLDRKSRNISLSRVKNIQLERLEKDVRDNQELYDAFLARFKEADLSSSGSQLASARIIDRALPPGGPIYPQKQRIILMWTLGGLFLGIMLALLREQLDTTFKSGRVIEDKLNLPLFGVVQAMPSNLTGVERHYLENKRSVFSESINHIRTGVTYSNVDNPPRVILITSSVQSEGKTTVASNLALSYAQLGPTLLIDADLRRPRIKHIIETDHSNGLVDYVAGVVSLKECLSQDKEEDNLYILNSGTTPPNPLELLASEKFSAILTALRSKFTYIIIDTAPVLPASDAVVLGQLSDALLMVVQSDRTTHHMARDAIKRLNASRVEVDGLVLSQANIKKGNPYQYGGYYGYGAYAYVEDED